MSVSLVCDHFSPTASIEETVERTIISMGQKIPRIDDVSVCLSKVGRDFFSATLRVHAFHQTLVSKSVNPDLYTAIEEASTKLAKQFRHLKTKRLKKRRKQQRELLMATVD